MKWVTREHVHVDRVACPWLIKRFVDPEAEFLFVPAAEVMAVAAREGGRARVRLPHRRQPAPPIAPGLHSGAPDVPRLPRQRRRLTGSEPRSGLQPAALGEAAGGVFFGRGHARICVKTPECVTRSLAVKTRLRAGDHDA